MQTISFKHGKVLVFCSLIIRKKYNVKVYSQFVIFVSIYNKNLFPLSRPLASTSSIAPDN